MVARARKASGLSLDAWNDLPEAERETLLATMVETFKADAARTPTRKAKAAKAGKQQPPAEDKEQKAGENKGARS